MSIEGLIDEEVMRHLGLFGCVKNMDPFAQHILKKSQHPLMCARRAWMRRTALRQCLEAHQRQAKINEEFKDEPLNPKSSLRRAAVIDDWFADDMRRRHNTTWNNKDFLGSVKEANPAMFPKRG